MWPLLKNISPWSIVYNFLVSPLFSAVLFPASVLTFIIPVLNRMTEPLWQLFFDLLKLGPTLRTSQTMEIPSVTALWIYVIAIHALLRLLPLWNESADRRLRELSSAL